MKVGPLTGTAVAVGAGDGLGRGDAGRAGAGEPGVADEVFACVVGPPQAVLTSASTNAMVIT